MKYAIGIDIGGTKISLVLGTEKGKILTRREIKTGTRAKTKACIQELVSNLRALILHSCLPPKKILGIGVGCPGAVDSSKGMLPRSPNLPGWKGIPLRNILHKATGLPVFLANDANAAALAELLFGVGKRTKNFIYMTVSTGIGGGIVIHGRLYEGSGFVAGEVGHLCIVPGGKRCRCGKQGCLEAYASGTAIAQDVRERMTSKDTILGKWLKGHKKISAKLVGMAAREGDTLAIDSYRKAGHYLGIGIANILNVLNPEKIVIGGGVLRSAHPIFWKNMMKHVKLHAWPEAYATVQILPSGLRGSVGDLGALALVFQNQCGGRP
jgi:glucokinase